MLHQFVHEGSQIRVADGYYAIHLSSSVGATLTPAKVTTRTLLALRAESGLQLPSGCKNMHSFIRRDSFECSSLENPFPYARAGTHHETLRGRSLEIRAGSPKMQHQGCQTQCDHSIHDRSDMPQEKKRKKCQEFSGPCIVPGYRVIATAPIEAEDVTGHPCPYLSKRSHI